MQETKFLVNLTIMIIMTILFIRRALKMCKYYRIGIGPKETKYDYNMKPTELLTFAVLLILFLKINYL